MKTKTQKLGLKKINVARLSNQEMNIVKAGDELPISCDGPLCKVRGGEDLVLAGLD